MARSPQGDPRLLVEETASALRGLHLDPGGLVLACRRIVERHPSCGPLWWLAARLVTEVDPFEHLRDLAEWIVDDPTPVQLARALPDDATVVLVGWPDLAADAVARRGDLRVLVVDSIGEGAPLVRRLERADMDVELVEPAGVAAAVAAADLVVIEAVATGDHEAMARIGSAAAAAVAKQRGIATWAVRGRGRHLPEGLWTAMVRRNCDAGPLWQQPTETVPWSWTSQIVHEDGVDDAAGFESRPDCVMAPELLRTSPI